ncbi:MAG: glycosyltransferase [Desulfuromonadales bacterium]|nr:glycosyltransferase [Desulfuromonadales bacterium]
MDRASHTNKRITLAYFIDFLADRRGATGGTERQLLETIVRLDKEKFRPILFCLQQFGGLSLWDNLCVEKYLLDVYSLRSISALRALAKTIRILRKEGVDVVQTYFHDATLFGIVAAKLAAVPVVMSCRRDLGFWYGEKVPKFFSLANHMTDRFVVNSESVQETVVEKEKLHKKQIEIIPNGIDFVNILSASGKDLVTEFPKIKAEDRIIGIVANFSRSVKRLDLFLNSASLVVALQDKVKFLIIGGGKLENDLREQAKKLNLEDVVIFAGPRENPIQYIKTFTIGVLCSDSEGFSNTILEYMVAGLPVVATAVGGNREIVIDGETGKLVPPDDPQALADALCTLLDDPARCKRMGEAGRKIVQQKFDWGPVIQHTEKFYTRLVANPQ